ncbi:lipocalin family protein [Aquipseudomonas alcaligenes]|uniref:lipocalin family protein n=1 Tax=Aquipseudomonas alcaligenes TaxID=43263 RepID=UPI00374A3723
MRPIFLSLLLVLAGCAGSDTTDNPPATAGQVDLQRYQGTWYELARLPMFFQRDCVASEAHYRLQEDGRVAVTNRCRTAEGEWQEARGAAEAQVVGRTDKLWVRFDNWFSNLFPGLTKGDYWVLYLDADYQVALVGHPNRENLWLLSRTPQVSAETRERLLSEARERDYDTGELIWRTD